MLENILPPDKRYFDKKTYIKAINERICLSDNDLKEIVLNDFSALLETKDLNFNCNKQPVKIHHNKIKQSLGSSIIVYTFSQEKANKEKAEDKRIKDILRQLKKSRIPSELYSKNIDTLTKREELEKPIQTVKKYSKNIDKMLSEGTGLFMYGGVGSGKTLLFALLGKSLIKKDKSVLFYDLTDLFTIIRQSFNKNSSVNEEEILREIISANILILDDLGAEKPTDWVLDKLFYIINQRILARRPILITSNYKPEALLARLGKEPRIISRLVGKSIIIDNKASDYRIIKHREVMDNFKDLD